MRTAAMRATVYLDPELHKALRLKAVETSQSISKLVNDAIKECLAEDAEDIAAFEKRAKEPLVSHDQEAEKRWPNIKSSLENLLKKIFVQSPKKI